MILNLFSMFSLRSCSVFLCLFVITHFDCYTSIKLCYTKMRSWLPQTDRASAFI